MKINKHTIKRICPPFVVKSYSKARIALDERRRRKMATKDIFEEIYDNQLWGKSAEKFNSGSGTSEEFVTKPYVKKISGFLKKYGSKKPKVLDLGCGNFEVGKHFVKYCKEYVGIDIVPKMIDDLNRVYGKKSVKFLCLDAIDDKLPAADIVFVRQVLQHLSNEQILKILPKLKKYKTVFITEHYPSAKRGIKPNRNIVPGSAIRAYKNSGVYLDKPPFNIPKNKLKLFLEVPGAGLDKGLDQGVIRTYKVDW